MTWTVYALLDPRDAEIRYIGMTKNYARRIYKHLTLQGSGDRINWLSELADIGLKAFPIVLENCETWSEADKAESFYFVEGLREGAPLLNSTRSNAGVKDRYGLVAKKISDAIRGNPATVSAIVSSNKRNWEDAEYARRVSLAVSASNTRRALDRESHFKMCRAGVSAVRLLWADPTWRANEIAARAERRLLKAANV